MTRFLATALAVAYALVLAGVLQPSFEIAVWLPGALVLTGIAALAQRERGDTR